MSEHSAGRKGRVARLAGAALVATVLLIALGNVVTATGSGMGCGDDWPHCNGALLPEFFNHTVVIEYGHRALAGIVSLLALGTAMLARSLGDTPARRHIGRPAAWALGALVVQVLLGAVTVKLELPPSVVMMHLATSMVFLALIAVAYGRARGWALPQPPAMSPKVTGWAVAALAVTFAQIVLGAYMRHRGAAAACTGLPACGGAEGWLPLGQPDALVHMLHRFGGLAAAGCTLGLWWRARRATDVTVRRGATLAIGAVGLQILLGAVAVSSSLAVLWTTLHVLVATVLLAALAIVTDAVRPARSGWIGEGLTAEAAAP